MRDYISTIIYICVFSIILELILPENKLKKYIGVLVSFIIILTLITPVFNLLESESVVATLSNAIDSVKSRIDVKDYDFGDVQNRIILFSTKENIEKEIAIKCKEKFDKKYEINKVKITLGEDYTLKNIDVYVKKIYEVAHAGEIIDYIAGNYNIQSGLINVIKEKE